MPWRPREQGVTALRSPLRTVQSPRQSMGFSKGRQVAAERLLHARADLNLLGSTAARMKAQRGPQSGELLTLLLTPGRFRADKPSQDKGL